MSLENEIDEVCEWKRLMKFRGTTQQDVSIHDPLYKCIVCRDVYINSDCTHYRSKLLIDIKYQLKVRGGIK